MLIGLHHSWVSGHAEINIQREIKIKPNRAPYLSTLHTYFYSYTPALYLTPVPACPPPIAMRAFIFVKCPYTVNVAARVAQYRV